jgi:hypothetical protein
MVIAPSTSFMVQERAITSASGRMNRHANALKGPLPREDALTELGVAVHRKYLSRTLRTSHCRKSASVHERRIAAILRADQAA